MLWHAATGPLCVSSMSRYVRIEGSNMSTPRTDREIAVLTPRLERGPLTSALDRAATLSHGEDRVTARGRLTDIDDRPSKEFRIETRFEQDSVQIHAKGEGAVLVLPIVSRCDEPVHISDHRVEIVKPNARVVCESAGVIRTDGERVFHFVPGVQALQLEIDVPSDGIDIVLRIQPL
jgi:hypothetical protein